MAESVTFETQPRETRGTRAARKLRKVGHVPAVIYGHKEATETIQLSLEEFEKAIRHGARVVDLKTNRGLQKVLIREIQCDYLGKEVLHIDFTRVSVDERITVNVAIELRGTAPGVNAGGVLDQPLHTLSVECLAISVPEAIRVNINDLQLGASIHVRDLVLPPDVKVMSDPDAIVVHITAPQAEAETAVAGIEGGEQAEPEVIGRQRAAEEESE